MERSLYWYMGSLHILTNTHTTALTTKQVARKVLFPPCLIEHISLSQITMAYTQKKTHQNKASIKENGYQTSIISKIFKRITNNHSLSQSQQQTQIISIQVEEIRMSINLRYAEGTSETLRHILRSYKVRSTLYTERTLRLCKHKD